MNDHEAIAGRYGAWIKAFNGGNLDDLIHLYSAEVVLNPPGGQELAGREAVRQWIGHFFEHNRARQTQVTEEVQAFGDWAWQRGRFEIELSEKRSGPFETIRGAHLMIWKRDDAAEWLIYRDIWNLT
ncbi:MAG: nuclear transport factor 2 family protein [Acidobacteria bacterium]|uniref:Nuclear transport factor 2 family protein n=1 Tax=Candidatus Polarisedimenticola svalbardensis TaxID=2886004 RepID=A0A8J6XX20_9BACT|nr:nuclear transport factor 2 family protein [Candidatus Polarisedimenticola svalbardensis]